MMDASVREPMKDAAKCVKLCDVQTLVTQRNAECTLYFLAHARNISVVRALNLYLLLAQIASLWHCAST